MLNNGGSADDAGVAAVRKALQILCEFDGSGRDMSVSDLSRRLSIPKSTTHNLLTTLERLDFLRKDPADRRYRLGPRVYELGLRFSRASHLVSVAGAHLERLAEETKETVKLGLLSCDEILVLAAIESPYELHTRGDIGRRAPLHSTGLGKAVLAALPLEEVRRIAARRGLTPRTPHSIGSLEKLEQELERARADGFSVDQEENEPGVVCVAAALALRMDTAMAAVSVSAPSSRVNAERLAGFSRLIVQTAQAVESAVFSR